MALAADPIELVSGIDAVYLSGRTALPQPFLEQLAQLQEDAREQGSPVDWSLGGTPVRVPSHGVLKHYRFAAVHEHAVFGFTPSEHLPPIRVQPRASALHAIGPELTVLWVRNVLDAAGIDATLSVSRLDLHADWQRLTIDADDRLNFVTYSSNRALYEVDETVSGLNLGKRGAPIYCRIYDKSREMAAKGDDWLPEFGGDRYDPDLPVTRVEFEFRREGLKEFSIDTPEDAFDLTGPLWAYATTNWLSLRVPTSDDTKTRWPIDSRWASVQRASLAGGSIPAERIRAGKAAGGLRKTIPPLVGYLTNAAVHLGTSNYDDTVNALRPIIAAHETQTGTTITERIETKRRRL